MLTERPLLDPTAAQTRRAAHGGLPTAESRLVIAWVAFGSLVVCVLSVGAMIGAFFP